MAENITLKIFTPEKTALNKKVFRVVLPYGNVNLTVIEDRAPTSLILHQGVMKILDENNQATNYYFIDSGVVDIANNECKISTLRFIEHSKISIEQALNLAEKEPKNQQFYFMIAEYLKNFA